VIARRYACADHDLRQYQLDAGVIHEDGRYMGQSDARMYDDLVVQSNINPEILQAAAAEKLAVHRLCLEKQGMLGADASEPKKE